MLIICNGMPRSGSTFVYNLVRLYLEQSVGVKSLGFWKAEGFETGRAEVEAAALREETFLLKTHDPFDPNVLSCPERVMEIYTIRDLRQIAESMIRVWGFSEDQVMSAISDHIKTAEFSEHGSQTVVLRYEDVEDRIPVIFKRVSEFLEVSYRPDIAQLAVMEAGRLGDKNREAFMSGIKIRISIAVQSLSRSFHAGRLLRRFLPERVVQDLKHRLMFVDKKTMLHPGHVRPQGDPMDAPLVRSNIELLYGDWLFAHGYMSAK